MLPREYSTCKFYSGSIVICFENARVFNETRSTWCVLAIAISMVALFVCTRTEDQRVPSIFRWDSIHIHCIEQKTRALAILARDGRGWYF